MSRPRHYLERALVACMKPQTAYTAAGLAPAVGATRKGADQALRRMASRGQLGERLIGGGHVYFTSQADADAFGAQETAALAEQLRRARLAQLADMSRRLKAAGLSRNKVIKPRPSLPAGVYIPAPPNVEQPVDMSQAVVTRAKTPIGRFAVDPASITPGAFLVDMPAGRWSDYTLRGAP